MIKDNQKSINRFQVVLDGLVMTVAYAAAWFIRIGGGFLRENEKRCLRYFT